MIVKLSDGSQVDLITGSKVLLLSPVFGEEIGIGPFEVVSFEGDLPDLLIGVDADGNQKIAPVSIDQISQVINKPVDMVEVKFPDGKIVLVDAKLAPMLQGVIDMNAQLMAQLAALLSGDALKAMQIQLDAMKLERDAAVAFSDKLRGSLPALEAAGAALTEVIASLKG